MSQGLGNPNGTDNTGVTQPTTAGRGIRGWLSAIYYQLTQGIPAAALPTAPITGQKLVATTGTAVQLTAGALTQGVIVQALAQNNNNIYVGNSGVTNSGSGTGTGFELQPGQAAPAAVANVSDLWINGTAGDGVCWIGS